MEIKKFRKCLVLVLALVMVVMAVPMTASAASNSLAGTMTIPENAVITVPTTETIILDVNEIGSVRKGGGNPTLAVKNYYNNTTETYVQMELDKINSVLENNPGAVIKEATLYVSGTGFGTATTSRRLQAYTTKTESDISWSWASRPQLNKQIGSYSCVNKDTPRTCKWDVLDYLQQRVDGQGETITFGLGLTQVDNNKQVNLLSNGIYVKVVIEKQPEGGTYQAGALMMTSKEELNKTTFVDNPFSAFVGMPVSSNPALVSVPSLSVK